MIAGAGVMAIPDVILFLALGAAVSWGQLVTSHAGLLTHRDCGLLPEIGMEPRRAGEPALGAQPESLSRAFDNCARLAATSS
jgi:hypothetical protein